MEEADTGGPIMSTAAQQLLADGMAAAVTIYNGFNGGLYENTILGLIDDLKALAEAAAGDVDAGLWDTVHLVLPGGTERRITVELLTFLVAGAKQLGDMSVGLSRLGAAARPAGGEDLMPRNGTNADG
jgi:hypothetical protein